jgi:hypothetical protein
MFKALPNRAVPWQAEPYRLWSLLEMIELHAAGVIELSRLLESIKWVVTTSNHVGQEGKEVRITCIERFERISPDLQKLPLSPAFKTQARRLLERLKDDTVGWEVLVTNVDDFQESLTAELQHQVFCWIPDSRREMFEKPELWFGKDVVEKFADARRDMRDCARCFALAQWSASVFHAMGVMEYGLRDLASRVQVTFVSPIELENWHNIIEAIEKRLKEMKGLPKGQRDDALIEFAAKASSHFFAVKEAWRNHVSHVRGRYDEEEAVKIVTNVRDFMRALAAKEGA